MNSKVTITYRQQISYCGKPQCRKCRDGIGHGPYWYAYRSENGRTTRTYIGKHLPTAAQAALAMGIQTTETAAARPPNLPPGRSHIKPLVGRETELETLRQLLFAPQHSPGFRLADKKKAAIPLDTLRYPQCVILMGEAGIGKTRLAEEISREAQELGWFITWSRSYAQESSIPYRLWIEVLRNVINTGLWHKQELARNPLAYARLAALLPELYDQFPAGDTSLVQSPGQEQQSLWEAVLAFFTAVSEHAPLLVVLDDIQWADASSCELFSYLVRRSAGLPLLFVGTCREAELAPRHPLRPLLAHMQREHTITTLSLQPLTPSQISALVVGSHLPRPILQYIQTQAAGNPFFAEELAYAYGIESPPISGSKQQAVLQRLSTLPRSIAAALDQRISKLSSDCQQLLSHAAILGGSFEFSLINSMETSNTTPVDEDTVLDLLDEALQAGVLAEEGRGTRVSYRFWQPLLVSHLYNSLSATKRALLHRRAADILQQVYSSREIEGAATITHHLVEGGGGSHQVARYAGLAGNYAYALSAYPEAEGYYRLAIEHLDASSAATHPGEPVAQNERLHLAYLLEQLGECLRFQGDYKEARRIFERALAERGRQQGTTARAEARRAAQVDALLESEIGWTWYYTGDYTRTRHYCERGGQVLRQAGVLAGPAWARLHFLQSYMLWQEGNYVEARRAAYQALKLFEEHLLKSQQPSGSAALTRLRRTLEGDPVDVARTHRLLGALANSLGQSGEALNHLNTALAILEQHDHQREVAHVSCNVGHIHLQKAEHALAQSFLRRSLNLAERIGDVPLTSVVFINLGELAGRAGDLTEAVSLFQRGLALAEEINDHIYIIMANIGLAAVLQDQGKLPEAGKCIRRSLAICRTMSNAPSTSLALLALAQMRIVQALEAQDQPDGANNHFFLRARAALQHALALQGLEAETEVKGQLALAQVSLLQGELETARQQAAQALEKARRYELTWLLAGAQRLLGSILSVLQEQEEADQHFKQAIQIFLQCDMRLEYARTLQSYAAVLLQREEASRAPGLSYLREAREIFDECEAELDLKRVERVLGR